MAFSTCENVSCMPTFCAHTSPNRLLTFKFLRFLQLQAHPRTAFGYMPFCLTHALSIIPEVIFFESSRSVIWRLTCKKDLSWQKAENNTHCTALFCLCDSCPYQSGTSTHPPHFKLALSAALTGTQLPVCLSAFLNKYTAIRPIQRPLTRSHLHILHTNKQLWGQQEGYHHLMSSQKFLSLASFSHLEHHGNTNP